MPARRMLARLMVCAVLAPLLALPSGCGSDDKPAGKVGGDKPVDPASMPKPRKAPGRDD
ncbi:MAG: hypothetical protein K2X87_17025 [Gemmataceae bacterium]|nr:hypothetical protein [Gemmataceae bacterium]